MIKIEVLYPEVCNLYGDLFNIKFLEKSIEDVKIINTKLTEKPKFVSEKVDMIYMGPMSERMQLVVIEKLKPYKEKIKELIEKGQVFLFTGNAPEVLANYIEDDKKEKHDALGIFDYYVTQDLMHRFNTLFMGTLRHLDDEKDAEEIKIMAFKATFSFMFGDNKDEYAFKSIKGCGINKESDLEGIRKNNFFGTSLIGPVLTINPDFSKYLMKLMGVDNPKIAFEDVAKECFEQRLKEFEDSSKNYLQ